MLDDDGNLCGVIALKDILRYNVPLDLVEKDDFNALSDLKPYAEVIAKSADIKVKKIMRSDFEKICEDQPAAKLIKMFLNTAAREVLVVDREGRLRGEVKLRDLAAKVFWE